jgi:hypothetical protein
VSTVTIETIVTAVTLRVMHGHVIVTSDLPTCGDCGLSRPHPFFDWVYNPIQDLLQHSFQEKNQAAS